MNLGSRKMWELVHIHWWSWPRFVIYDYDGHDGRRVWSWTFDFLCFRLIRMRISGERQNGVYLDVR